MAFIKTQDGTELFCNDWGRGTPVVLLHGWPLNADMWSEQAVFLAERGLRVITYDRRGFGRSSQPWEGYEYDTLADDLGTVLECLDVRDAVLVGFSMGGGEVARYLARHGTARVAKAALVAAVTPYLVKTADNPTGVDTSVFDGIQAGLRQDRPHFLGEFGKTFYGNGLLTRKVSAEILAWSLQMAMMASLRATMECAKAWSMTDFRADLRRAEVPVLVIHGTADETVPIDSSARVAARLLPNCRLAEYEGEPHGLHATAKDRLNDDLLAFAQG